MLHGLEIARVIEEFEGSELSGNGRVDTHHHDQTASVQKAFARDVRALVTVIEDLGNPFEEMSQEMIVLDTKEIADSAVLKTVRNAKRIGQEQFDAFTKECLVDRKKSTKETIHRNKLTLFSTTAPKPSRGKQQLSSLKCDVELFSRLYIGCQTRDGNLEEFLKHENQACPPSLSSAGKLHLGTKSDMLVCLENLCEAQTEAPEVTNVIIDGAAIVQMLKPGGAETFEEYAHQVFIPYISRQLQNVSRLDLVWDRYVANTLKATARAKRGKGIRQRVIASAHIPRNWPFFCVWTSTNRNSSASSQGHLLSQSNTKRTGCHRRDAAFFACQHNRMLIPVLQQQKFPVVAHKIAASLGSEKSLALPMFSCFKNSSRFPSLV